jgi:DNA-binding response OmpR family regulator
VHVLLVEDEPDLADPIARILEREGYRVSAVRSATEARHRATAAIDVVLLDVMLPEGEDAGFALARELRAAGYAGKLLFLTARDSAGDRLRALDLGADGILLKPFSLRDVVTRLRGFASP